jgi:hypothetical protein
MERKQLNRVTMFKTVDGYLENHTTVWSCMIPFGSALTDWRAVLASIDGAAQLLDAPSGATDTKAAARDALEDILFLICEAMGVLGHTSNNHDLIVLTDLSRSAIANMNAQDLVNRATTVLDQANENKTSLAAMLVTQANLDEFAEALASFGDAKEGPRMKTIARTVQTESLESLIRKANDILRNRIDPLVNLFLRSDPDFVAGYRGTRVVIDRRATHGTNTPEVTPAPQPST